MHLVIEDERVKSNENSVRKFKEYDITFSGLKQGKHQFDYQIDGRFFELFGNTDFTDVSQQVKVILDKKSTFMELSLFSEGTVNVHCDVTDEPFDLQTKGEMYLLVKFGEAYNDEDDQVLVLPQGAYQMNIAQYLYELIVLSVPAKRVHPDVERGVSDSEMLEQIEKYSVSYQEEETEQANEVDPRWEKLKKLLK